MIELSARKMKRYGAIALLTALFAIATVVAFNAAIDPYGMYHAAGGTGIHAHKPAIYHRVRLAKAYELRRYAPSTVILGTSRTHVGIRPAHPAWPADARPVYNLAFDGATTKEMYYYLRHAQAMHPLRYVLLGLDNYQLNAMPATVRPDFDAQRLLYDRSLISKARLYLADLKLLASIDTVSESVATLRAQDDARAEWFAADGQRLGDVFFHQASEGFEQMGPRDYFDKIDRQEVEFKLEWRIPTRHTPKAAPVANELTSLDYIERILAFCRENNIRLLIYITPAHAHQLEIAAATGEWPTIENGKRALVRMLSDDTHRHPQQASVPLYDFSTYSSITMEALPPAGSREELRYYWESSHYKERTGDLVLNRIFGIGEVPDDFGVRLTSDNIDQAFADIRRQQHAYRAAHPADVALLRSYVADYKTRHHIPDWEN